MIDVNVHLDRWPFRRLAHDGAPALVAHLRSHGITQAWAGSFDAIFHRDVAAVNARLAEDCRQHGPGFFVPFGVVNPRWIDWEEDLRRCVEVHLMPGIRVYPNYHGYSLDDAEFIRLAKLVAGRKLLLQIVVSLEDERTQHALVRVRPVDVRPLVPLVERHKELAVILLNAYHGTTPSNPLIGRLAAAGKVHVEIATLEGVGGVEWLLKAVRLDRVLFGSHAPYFSVESALAKLDESPLAQPQRQQIGAENARRLLAEIDAHAAAQHPARERPGQPAP